MRITITRDDIRWNELRQQRDYYREYVIAPLEERLSRLREISGYRSYAWPLCIFGMLLRGLPGDLAIQLFAKANILRIVTPKRAVSETVVPPRRNRLLASLAAACLATQIDCLL